MADSVLEQVDAQLAGLLPVFYRVKCQHGGQFLIGQGETVAHAVLLADQHLGPFRDGDPGAFGDHLGAAAHKFSVHAVAVFEQEFADLLRLLPGHKIAALLFQLRHHLVVIALLADDGLLGGADGAVVKGLAGDNGSYRLLNVRGPLYIGRGVACAYADGGLSGAVGGLYHARAAGGDDHGDFLAVHKLVGRAHGGHGDAADHAFGGSGRQSGVPHHLSRFQGAFGRGGMG